VAVVRTLVPNINRRDTITFTRRKSKAEIQKQRTYKIESKTHKKKEPYTKLKKNTKQVIRAQTVALKKEFNYISY
jgi:hypothetical protein